MNVFTLKLIYDGNKSESASLRVLGTAGLEGLRPNSLVFCFISK